MEDYIAAKIGFDLQPPTKRNIKDSGYFEGKSKEMDIDTKQRINRTHAKAPTGSGKSSKNAKPARKDVMGVMQELLDQDDPMELNNPAQRKRRRKN